MFRAAALFTFLMLLFSVQIAWADFYDDCLQGCGSTQTQCIEAITLYDPAGIAEARQACAETYTECKSKCHADDAKGNDEAGQARARHDAEEAERKQLEQQETVDGIKILKLD
jgi:hypothetical protein